MSHIGLTLRDLEHKIFSEHQAFDIYLTHQMRKVWLHCGPYVCVIVSEFFWTYVNHFP